METRQPNNSSAAAAIRCQRRAARRLSVAMTLAFACCCGCSDSNQLPTASVSGVVTLDGEPVKQGSVIFTPTKGRVATGTLDGEGRFALSTYGKDDGAIIDRHQVAVISKEGSADDFFERAPTKSEVPKPLVPVRYANGATSGLSFEIVKGQNTINLELTNP